MTYVSRADELVDRKLDLGLGLDPVSPTLVRYWCEAFEDSNPRFWSEKNMIAPPGLMTSVCRLPYWPVDPSIDQRGIIGMVGDALALPESIVKTVDFEFDRDLRIGDRVRCVERVISISEQKTTRIGSGHFVRMERSYEDQEGGVIGRAVLDFFKYARSQQPKPVEAPPVGNVVRPSQSERGGLSAATRPDASSLNAGDELNPLSWKLNTTRMILMGYICRDFNPVHHDAEYARSNGLKHMFMQWACYSGVIGRYVARELGADGQMSRLKFEMRRPVYAGEQLEVRGTVVERSAGQTVLDISLSDSNGVATSGQVWTRA